CLPIPIKLSPLQKRHGVLIRCSSTWTTCEQSGTAKAPWKIQPDECRCPGKSHLSKPAIYAFNDPEWLGGNFEGHSPCVIFVALPTVIISLPIQQIEINDRNKDQIGKTLGQRTLSCPAVADNHCALAQGFEHWSDRGCMPSR